MLTLALAACAAVPRLEPPKVTVDTVRVDRLTATAADFSVTLGLVNPNPQEIAVAAINADLTIEDVRIGMARLASPVRVPAGGEGKAMLVAHADLSATIQAAVAAAKRAEAQPAAAPTVRYAVSGAAMLDSGVMIPFARSGEFAWPRGGAAPR